MCHPERSEGPHSECEPRLLVPAHLRTWGPLPTSGQALASLRVTGGTYLRYPHFPLFNLYFQLSTFNFPLSTLNFQLSTLNSQLSTLNSQLSTLNSQLSSSRATASVAATGSATPHRSFAPSSRS